MDWFVKGTNENFKFAANGLISVINNIIGAFQIIPNMVLGVVEQAAKGSGAINLPGVKDLLQMSKSAFNFRIPTMYGGKDYAGPAMALEARMSGRRPMVVNDGEFVIPRDGFPTLAGIVGDNLRSTGVISSGPSQPVQVNVNLSITTNSVVANADELATALRDPVYKIIGDAWSEAYNAQRVHRNRP